MEEYIIEPCLKESRKRESCVKESGAMESAVKSYLLTQGADVCGIGNIDRFAEAPEGFSPSNIYPECKSVISFGVALPKGLTKVDSRLVYGHFNADIYIKIDELALKCAKYIEEQLGGIAVPMPGDGPYEYWDAENMRGKGLISMKHTAVLCGLGELGKSTLLLNPKYGTLLAMGALFTNLDLKSDDLVTGICIEGCHKCLDACPVHAIENGTVNQKLCRTNTYGKTARGFDTVDCNRCRVVCPRRFGL